MLRLVVDIQLPGVRPSLIHHGGSFIPHEASSTSAKTSIPPSGKLARSSVSFAIASLHWIDGQPVGYYLAS